MALISAMVFGLHFFHHLFKSEKVRVIFIEELYDLESALVHIKVDISLFKIRRHGYHGCSPIW